VEDAKTFNACNLCLGWPSPEVTWWRGGHLIDSTYEMARPTSASSTAAASVSNTLALPPLTATDLGAVLTCQARNNDVVMPALARTTVDLKCEDLKNALYIFCGRKWKACSAAAS